MKILDLLKKLNEVLPEKDRKKLFLIFILMLFGAVLEVLSIGIIAGFVTIIAEPENIFQIEWLHPLFTFLNIQSSRDILIYGSIFLIAIFFFKNAYIIFYRYISSRFVYNRYKNISGRLFNIYMNVPYSFHLRRNSADLIRNVTGETKILASHVMISVLHIAAEGVIAMGIILLLFIVEPLVTLITLVLLGGISSIFLKTTREKLKKYAEKALKERAKIIKTVNEGMGGFKDATVMGRQMWFVESFKKSIDDLSRAEVFQQVTRQSVRPMIEAIAVIGMLTITLLLLSQGYTIVSLASILALFAFSVYRLLPGINIIISEYSSLRYHAYSLEPIHSDLIKLKDYERKNKKNKKEEVVRLSFKDKIEVSEISYAYPESSESVLENISLTVKKGTAIGIVGATGSGKTTIVDLILGLLSPLRGEVKVDGKNIKDNLQPWQKNIGYIPQFIYLSDDTIFNNIAFGIEEEKIDRNKVEKAAEMAQVNEFTDRLTEKLDTVIGEHGIRLSGGQRQRIGIARALYHDPELLVMDEATSSLDSVMERYVIEAIERLKKDRTIIIVAHRLGTVKNCDQIYIVKDKKIAAQGTYNKLLESNSDFKLMADLAK